MIRNLPDYRLVRFGGFTSVCSRFRVIENTPVCGNEAGKGTEDWFEGRRGHSARGRLTREIGCNQFNGVFGEGRLACGGRSVQRGIIRVMSG